MAWVVFLRAVNVGGTNRCQPALIAKQLAKFDIVNIGAVGTFVVREDVSGSALRAAIARKLPFKCEIMICPAKEILDLVRKNPFVRQPSGPDITRFVTIAAKALRAGIRFDLPQIFIASPARTWAGEDHCDSRPIRPRSVSSADEGDQLPRQDREAPGRAGHDPQLEHDREDLEDSKLELAFCISAKPQYLEGTSGSER